MEDAIAINMEVLDHTLSLTPFERLKEGSRVNQYFESARSAQRSFHQPDPRIPDWFSEIFLGQVCRIIARAEAQRPRQVDACR